MSTVSIEINSKWVMIARSPIIFIIQALQGISISFAPLFLYWSGRGNYFNGLERLIVPACFAVIFLVPAFYFWLGGEVVRQLRRK